MPHHLLRRACVCAVLCVAAVVPLFALSSDDFTGTGALGATWTVQQGDPQEASDELAGGAAGENTAYSTAEVWGNSHYSSLVLKTTDTNTNLGVTVRASGTGGSSQYYLLACGAAASNSGTLYKVTGGTSYSSLVDWNTDYASTDTCLLSVVGTTLTGYKNGSPIGSTTNSDLTGGSPGIYVYLGSTVTADDWFGDTLTAGCGALAMRGAGC